MVDCWLTHGWLLLPFPTKIIQQLLAITFPLSIQLKHGKLMIVDSFALVNTEWDAQGMVTSWVVVCGQWLTHACTCSKYDGALVHNCRPVLLNGGQHY